MRRMKPKEFRPVVHAYGLSIAVWCGLSLLTGVQYRVFDKEMNMHSSFFDMLLLAESQGFAFALLTPPIFYLARRYIGGARDRFRYLLFYCPRGRAFHAPLCVYWVVRFALGPSPAAICPTERARTTGVDSPGICRPDH